MKSILVELHCRQCMYHTYRKSETLVLSDFETQARNDLLADTFFTLRCPRCGELIEFIHPLAYVDTKHKFILFIKSKKDITKEDVYLYQDDTSSHKRFIFDHTKIAEKIHIFEDELDDRVIEIAKLKLKQQLARKQREIEHITYHDMDKQTKTIWFETQSAQITTIMAITLHDYNIMKQTLSKAQFDHFECVDESWVLHNM